MLNNDDDAFECGYEAGCQASRAALTSDMRVLVDRSNAEVHALRCEFHALSCEVRALLGLPPPAPLDVNGRRMQ